MDTPDADVLIVGAGPTGLMLAGELRLRGVSVIVVDRLDEPMRQSRALGFSARTIEEFDQRGLLSRLGGVEVIPFGHFGGVPLDFGVVEGGSYGARGIPQSRTEGMLTEWAGQAGVQVRRGCELVGLTQTEDGVTAGLSTHDGPVTVRTRYLVGCDGSRSAVRRLVGIDFSGTDAAIELRFADVAGIALRPRFSGERVPGGMVMVLPLGPDRSRLIYFDRSEPLRRSSEPITYEEFAEAFQRLSGEDVSAATPLWVSSTTDTSRQAAEYRRGRVFLAGDAAHIHLPIGAQGMSAGVQDAVNLAWKLSLELQGQAPEGLLDTYQAERHPVGARILANTLAQRILYLGGPEIDPLLDVFTELTAEPAVQRLLVGMVTGLDIRHEGGPDDHPLLGRRLPGGDLLVGEEKTTAFALLHAGRPLLLDLADDAALRAAASGWADRVDVVTVAEHGWDPALRGLLVRPDGYLAWVGAEAGTGDVPALTAALTRWFGAAC